MKISSRCLRDRFLVAVVLVIILALFAGALTAFLSDTSSISSADDSEDPWYYGEEYLNMDEVKDLAASLKTEADVLGTIDPIVIAIIDTGLDLETELINGKWDDVLLIDENEEPLGYDVENESTSSEDWADSEGGEDDENYPAEHHGTKMAAIIANLIIDSGLQDYIKIYPIKASRGDTSRFPVEYVADAVEYAIEIGADVINMSIAAADSTDDDGLYAWTEAEDGQRLITAINASSSTTIFVAAAGNNTVGSDSSSAGGYYPASYDNVIGVMGYSADLVNYGSTNYGSAYDMFAPAQNAYTYLGSGAEIVEATGTSVSSAIVSATAAMLMLNAEVQSQKIGEDAPRATVLSKLLYTITDGDSTVTVTDTTYEAKAVNMVQALSMTLDDLDYSYSEVTGISISGTTAGGQTLLASSTNSLIVQTIRESTNLNGGQGKSLVTLNATLLPYWDVDPTQYANIVWTIAQYGDDGELVEDSEEEIGTGETVQYLFSAAGNYIITASIETDDETFSAEMDFAISEPDVTSLKMQIVEASYIETDEYIYGSVWDVLPSSAICYRSGITLTVTGIEDTTCIVEWRVDGQRVAYGNLVTFIPESLGEYTIRAYIYNSTGELVATLPAFIIDCRSYAEHPLMIPVWIAIAITIAIGTLLLVLYRKRKGEEALKKATTVNVAEDIDVFVELSDEEEETPKKKRIKKNKILDSSVAKSPKWKKTKDE